MLPESFTPSFLKRLQLLHVHSRRAYLGLRQGGHISLKRGHGIEFADYRPYQLGDHPRNIDWGVYARSEKLYVRTFQEEQNITLLVVIDTSPSMLVPESDRKWERASEVALSIGAVALLAQDDVRLAPLGLAASPKFSGPRALHSMGQFLARRPVSPKMSFARGAELAATQVRFPGVCVLISDFLFPVGEMDSALRALRAKNLDITTIQLLGVSDEDPCAGLDRARLEDAETGEELDVELLADGRERYHELLNKHIGAVRETAAANSVRHLTLRANQTLDNFLFGDVLRSGLLATG